MDQSTKDSTRGGLRPRRLHGDTYEVARQVCPVINPANGGPLRLGDPRITSVDVPAGQLADRFWEFVSPHFQRCGGELGA